MRTTHKNADIIKQWVDGAIVESQSPTTDEWTEAPMATELWVDNNYLLPSPIHPCYDYLTWRVKE